MTKQDFVLIGIVTERFSPQDKVTRKALGLSGRLAELFWVGLRAMDEKTGRLIPNFNKLSAKLGFSSAYITELKQRGMVESGDKRGDWLLTDKALKKMAGLASGEEQEAGAAPARRRRKKNRKKLRKNSRRVKAVKRTRPKARKKNKRAPDPKVKVAVNNHIEKLRAHLDRLDKEIEVRNVERKQILNDIESIFKDHS